MMDVMFEALRKALIAAPGIGDAVEEWKGEPGIFTRRPVPQDAPERIIIINEPIGITDWDFLNSDHPLWNSDIGFYGRKGTPGTSADDTRAVDQMAGAARLLFHRQRFSVQPTGFSVTDVRVGGPFAGPTDDDKTVARIINLRIRLRRA